MLTRRLCILIAHRDIDAADALGALCERLGHEVDFAYDSAAAREAARWLKPDVVLAARVLANDLAEELAAELTLAGTLLVELVEGFDVESLLARVGRSDGATPSDGSA